MSNDMGAQQSYQRSLLDAISTVVQRRIDGLKLDKTIVGIIDKNMGTLNGRPLYQVKYEGGVFTATARDSSESYARNTAVYVTVPQSDFSKEKFIVGRASSISASTAEDTAISATINNYVKLGGNLIDGSASIGLRSYHDPIEEETDSDSILHRARFLYNVDPELTSIIDIKQDAFKVYMQDAKNILLKADFRTLLDATQQRTASGRYGLAVTLTFANPNAGYGETQGEILDNLGSTIIGSAPRLNVQGKVVDTTTNTSISTKENNGWVSLTDNIDNISLKEWDNKLQLFLNSNDAKEENSIKSWQTNGIGLFDCYSQYIQTMYQTFCINNAAAQSAMTDNLVTAYINLLSDLKNADSNLDSIKKIYDDWKAVSIGDLSDVDETIYLTSDVMLGNPFSFTSWNTQYVVSSQQYDFSRFKEVKSILFFKEGFQEDSNTEQIWPPSDAPANGGKGWDIFCQNIELFLLKDLDAEYQDLSLRVECANDSDGILRTLLPTEKVTFNAHVFRNYIEELTGNANIEYVWLRQDSQVINASHPDFYHYAGVGWKRLRNTNRYLFQTTGNENWAYKNIYKCVALYQDGTQTVPLSTNFIVYNNAVSTKIKLESDLGTNFTFTEGSPTISCLIQEEPLPGKIGEAAENYQEYGYINDLAPLYKYHWSIRDIANDSVLFLEEATSENNSNILKENILSKIKMWCFDFVTQELKETDDPTRATRIQYPVSLSSGGFIVECIVQKNFSLSKESELLTEHLIFTKYTENCSEIWNQYQKDYQILSQWEEELNEVDAINNQYETQRNNIWNRYKDDSETREAEIRELEERYEEIFSQLNQKYIENKENREKYPDLFKETYQESISAFKETYTTLFSDLKESVLEDVEDLPYLEEFFEKFTVTIETNFNLKNQSKNISSWLCDKCDYYNVGNATIDITNLSTVSSSSYRIAIENGDQVFQYDVYGNAPTETKFKDPLEIKPLKAKIIGPTGLEFSGENANIEWIFNLEDTLIVPPEGLVLNPATQQEQIIKGPECTFTIEKLYNPNAQNNQITCHAHFNDIDVYTDTTFNFSKVGSNGTNGTDVVSVIKYNDEKNTDKYFVLHNQPLTLYTQKGCPIPDSEEVQIKGMLNVPGVGSELKTTIQLTPDILNVHLYQKGEEVDKSKFAGGYPRWNLAGNADGTTNDTGKYFKIDKDTGYNIVWDPTYHDDKKSLLLQTIRSEVSIAESDQTYYSFFSLPIIEYEPDSTLVNDRLPIQRIAIDKNSYLKDVVYNSDGRNPIYNHNQGLKLINLPENSIITWEARGGLNAIKSDNTNIVTEYCETEPCFSLGFEKDTKKEVIFSKLYTQRTSSSDQVYQQAVYEKEKEEILKEFKQKRLRALQEEAKEKFWNECQQTGKWPIRTVEKDNEGNETIVYWTEESIRNGQRTDMDYQDYFWFSQHVDLWWNADEIISYYPDPEEKYEDEEGKEKSIVYELYLDETGEEKPIRIWDDSRYQIIEKRKDEQDKENEVYSTYYKVYIKQQRKDGFQEKVVTPITDTDKSKITPNLENEVYPDYRYKTIYCKVDPPLSAEDYFESVYPKFENKTPDDTQIIEDNLTEAMIYVLPDDTYDGSATNNRIEAKIYILEFEEKQSSSENPDSSDNSSESNDNNSLEENDNNNSNDNTNNENTSEEIDNSSNNDSSISKPQFKLYATVYVPINMTLDTFGLDSINAWDGNSVTIDKERGAILAPQVGAGEKDSNNRFTGILMGKTNTYTGQSDSENQIGLFGYSYGIQSIFLDAKTGNADFGLPNGNSLQLDPKGNYIGLKNDDYNEGRIELRPGGVSKVGGWRLGHRSLYYTKSGNIGPRYKNDYIPNINTGKIVKNSSDPYSAHHEKDIDYKDSGILLHSGDDPYISIKGRELTEDDIPDVDLGTYLRPKDSLEIQLDPKTPTLFTIFRHNGSNWVKQEWTKTAKGYTTEEVPIYEEGTRTYLAGINGKGEFVANTVSSIINVVKKGTEDEPEQTEENVYSTQFSVNSFNAFDDPIEEATGKKFAGHTGLKIKVGAYTIGQLFINNRGLNPQLNEDTTLYITGGRDTADNEYSRPIGLYGKEIKLFTSDLPSDKTTDFNLILKKDSLTSQVGSSYFKLLNDINKTSSLMTNSNFKTNIGIQQDKRYEQKKINNQYIWLKDVSTLCIKIDDEHYCKFNSWGTNIYYLQNDIYIEEGNIKNEIGYYKEKNSNKYYSIKEINDQYIQIKKDSTTSYVLDTSKRYVWENIDENKTYDNKWDDSSSNPQDPTYNSDDSNSVRSGYIATENSTITTNQYVLYNGGYWQIASTSKYYKYYYIENNTLKESYINSLDYDSTSVYYWINKKMVTSYNNLPKYYFAVDIYGNNCWIEVNKIPTNSDPEATDPLSSYYRKYILDPTGNLKLITKVSPYNTVESISTKKYSFYSGEVYKKIVTNEKSSTKGFTEYKNNNNGIEINTSTGPILISSTDTLFDLKTNNGRIAFLPKDKDKNLLKKEGEYIEGVFSINSDTNGLFLSNIWLNLVSPQKMSLIAPDYFKLVSQNVGNAIQYNEVKPQIYLKAGNDEHGVTLMLNSSNNEWKTDIRSRSMYASFKTIYPLFKIRTAKGREIGIYPQHYRISGEELYTENLYINMSQYNTGGLKVEKALLGYTENLGLLVTENARFYGKLIIGAYRATQDAKNYSQDGNGRTISIQAARDIVTDSGNIYALGKSAGIIRANSFHGDGKNIRNTSNGGGSGVSVPNISGVGGTGTIKVLTVSHPNGRPAFGITEGTIKMPEATEIEEAIKGKLTWEQWLKSKITGSSNTDWGDWVLGKVGLNHGETAAKSDHTHTEYALTGHSHTVFGASIANTLSFNKDTGRVTGSGSFQV